MKNFPTLSTKTNVLMRQPNILTHKKLPTTNFTKKPANPLLISQNSNHKIINSSTKIIKSLNSLNSVSKPNLVLCNNIKPSNQKIKVSNYKSTPLKSNKVEDKKPKIQKEKSLSNTNNANVLKGNKQMSIKTASPNSKLRQLNSYGNTASSTANTENNMNNNLNNNEISKFQSLIENINLKNITSISKSEMLQNNIFLNKIFVYLSSLISPNYKPIELGKNEEIKSQFAKFEQKINNFTSNTSSNNNVNVINADMLNSHLSSFNKNSYTNNVINEINKESGNRKEVYKIFFGFFDEMCTEIEVLSKKLGGSNTTTLNNGNNNSLKKIEEVNSKISSLHSKINFSKNESQFLNSNNINNLNLNYGLNGKGMAIKNDFVPSILISSLNSEFYQKLLEESFKNETNTFLSIETEDIMNKPNDTSPKILNDETEKQAKKVEDVSDSGEIIYNYDDSSSNTYIERDSKSTPKMSPCNINNTKPQINNNYIPKTNNININHNTITNKNTNTNNNPDNNNCLIF